MRDTVAQVQMACEGEVFEDGHAAEQLDVLKRPRDAAPGDDVRGAGG